MAWARVDDGFHDHPKVGRLSLAAVGLWTLCFTWANKHLGASGLPPGFVPDHQPKKFGGSTKHVAELVAADLWTPVEGGWMFHDFVKYLPPSREPETASEISQKRSEAGKKGAQARWHPDSNLPSHSDAIAMPPSRTRPISDLPGGKSPAEEPDEPTRPDVEALCDHLADRIEQNGSKRPAITRRWRTSCRLLLDIDGRTPDQVRAAIDWCQTDPFWRSNVLSMPKLREKYDQMRLAAQRSQARPGDRQLDHLRDAYAWAQQYDAQAAVDTPAIGAS